MAIDMAQVRSTIAADIDQNYDKYAKLSETIWDYAETGLKEYKSSKLLADTLSEAGFSVEFGVSGMETAFIAEFGEGKPVVCYVAEYDALSNLSQTRGVAEKSPIEPGTPGHGCGHNLMGVAIVAAAIEAKKIVQQEDLSCTIRVIGTPAEETIGAKAFMVRDGLFEDVDCCLGYHSAYYNAVENFGMIAAKSVIFKFSGKSAHAGAAPHLGRSALDACELMNVGVNYLREHVKPEVRMHWCYINDGGRAANVVPANAAIRYLLRAKDNVDLLDVDKRVNDIAKGAALMTGTSFETEAELGISNFVVNDELGRICAEAMQETERLVFDEDDYAMAEKFRKTFTDNDIDAGMLRVRYCYPGREELRENLLITEVAPFTKCDGIIGGGSDLGDVSWVVPTVHFFTTTYANGTPGHSWQQVAQTATPIAHKGMIYAAKVMALSAIKILEAPGAIEKAKEELLKKTGGNYKTLLAPGQEPIAR